MVSGLQEGLWGELVHVCILGFEFEVILICKLRVSAHKSQSKDTQGVSMRMQFLINLALQ